MLGRPRSVHNEGGLLQLLRRPSQNRRYVALTVRVDTVRDSVRDDTLARPLLLTANGTRVYSYYDYGDVRVTAARI